MICLRNKFVFIHVPRTAGTSMVSALRDAFGKDSCLQPAIHCGVAQAADVISRHGMDIAFDEFFVWAFVRNPFSRAWSVYKRLLQDREHPDMLDDGVTFRQWATEILPGRIHASEHRSGAYRDQVHWLMNKDRNGIDVNWTGRFECLQEDWCRVSRILGIDAPLPRLNTAPGGLWWDQYDSASRTAVLDAYRRDFKFLGYPETL